MDGKPERRGRSTLEQAEEEFLEAIARDEGENRSSDEHLMFYRVAESVRRACETEGLGPNELRARLTQARRTLSDVAVALNLNRRGSAPGKLWEKPPYHTLTARPEDWYEASPVSADQLDQAVAAYLWSPWMQCDRLEWHILNGYFFDLLARGTDELRSGSFAGIIDWAYVFSGGSAERHVYARAGLELAKVLMRWVVPPAVIAWLLWRGAETASLWAGGAYALYLVWFVLSWPARWSHRRALREAYRKAQERLGLLTMLYMTVSGLVLNPRHLRGLMDEMQARELLLPSAAYAIVDRAIVRDPAVFPRS